MFQMQIYVLKSNIILTKHPCAKRDLCYILEDFSYQGAPNILVKKKKKAFIFSSFPSLPLVHTQTHRVPLGATLPEEYKRPDGGLWVESCIGSFLMTLPEVGLACLLRAVT